MPLARSSADTAHPADSQLGSPPTEPSTLGHRSTATSRCLHHSARLDGLRRVCGSSWPNGHLLAFALTLLATFCPWNPCPCSCFASRRKLCPSPGSGQSTRKPSEIFSPGACSYSARSRSYASCAREHVSREVELKQAQELPCCSRPDVRVVPFKRQLRSTEPFCRPSIHHTRIQSWTREVVQKQMIEVGARLHQFVID